jgi:hypothetical protein
MVVLITAARYSEYVRHKQTTSIPPATASKVKPKGKTYASKI